MRTIGLDYGTKTVGVAISDENRIIAQPLVTIERTHANKLRQTYAAIERIIAENDVDTIVLGLPKNMNNTEGERVEDTRIFKENLERRTALPVIFVDERLTTMEADRILESTGVASKNKKQYIDKMAVLCIIYLVGDAQPYK